MQNDHKNKNVNTWTWLAENYPNFKVMMFERAKKYICTHNYTASNLIAFNLHKYEYRMCFYLLSQYKIAL